MINTVQAMLSMLRGQAHEINRILNDQKAVVLYLDGDDYLAVADFPDHYVTFGEDGWSIEHSLPCRMLALLDKRPMHECEYHAAIERWVAGRMYRPDNDNGRRYCIVSVEEDGFPVLHRKTDA